MSKDNNFGDNAFYQRGEVGDLYGVFQPSLSEVLIDRHTLGEVHLDGVCSPDEGMINSPECAIKYLHGLLVTQEEADKKGVQTNMDRTIDQIQKIALHSNRENEKEQAQDILGDLIMLRDYGVTDIGNHFQTFLRNEPAPEAMAVDEDIFTTFDCESLTDRIDRELAVVRKCEDVLKEALADPDLRVSLLADARLQKIRASNAALNEEPVAKKAVLPVRKFTAAGRYSMAPLQARP